MLLKIEQGKGRKDRFAMLSPVLLELLRGLALDCAVSIGLIRRAGHRMDRSAMLTFFDGAGQVATTAKHSGAQLCCRN